MHAWLAFLAGILVVVGAFLILSADLGIPIYGLAVEGEVTVAVALLVVAAIFAYLFYRGVRAQNKTIKTGKEALIGAKGIVTAALTPKGTVRVGGEFWQATTENCTELPVDQEVEVTALQGMTLIVRAI